MKRTTILFGMAIAAVALAKGIGSGLKKGEDVPFHPSHFAEPLANTDKCFPCTFQNRPQVQVWVNGDSMENVAKIAKKLNAETKENGKAEFKALIVFIGDDAKARKYAAEGHTLVKKEGLGEIAMATLLANSEAVKNYKINLSPEVKNTVIVYKNWKVADKMVNLMGDEKGLKSLDAAIGSIVK